MCEEPPRNKHVTAAKTMKGRERSTHRLKTHNPSGDGKPHTRIPTPQSNDPHVARDSATAPNDGRPRVVKRTVEFVIGSRQRDLNHCYGTIGSACRQPAQEQARRGLAGHAIGCAVDSEFNTKPHRRRTHLAAASETLVRSQGSVWMQLDVAVASVSSRDK